MPTVPLPMIAALILSYLAIRTLVLRDRPAAFAVLIGAVALQQVLLSYSVFASVRPVTAAALPPLAWIVFQVTAVRPLALERDFWHLAPPAFTAFVLLVVPAFLDVVIPAIFIAYGAALLVRLRGGSDSLPQVALASGDRPNLIWRLIATALLVSALGDVLIAASILTGQESLAPIIMVVMTSGYLVAIGLLSLSASLSVTATDQAESAVEAAADHATADVAVVDAVNDLMTQDKLYLDPDLTLARLARRLRLPAKQVSAAVNRVTGENVSRLINGHRIRHACERLAAGSNVTDAMLTSGFGTKSNFNREFLRVTGSTPSAWASAGRRDLEPGPVSSGP